MATLKISDLSVGDWVEFKGELCKVLECGTIIISPRTIEFKPRLILSAKYDIYDCVDVDKVRPIPITAEILEKIGFESPSYYWSIYKDNGDYIEIWEDENRWYLSVNSVEFILCDLHWVHQIQHLMRVWGIDKEINL